MIELLDHFPPTVALFKLVEFAPQTKAVPVIGEIVGSVFIVTLIEVVALDIPFETFI